MKRFLTLAVLFTLVVCVGAQDQQPAPEAPTIYTAFGDSLTVGVGAATGYPPRLQALLQSKGINAKVVNRGRSGETTGGGVGRLPGVLSADHPAYLLLMEGTNDVSLQVDDAGIIANLETMVNMGKAAGAKVLLAALPPRKDSLEPASQRLNAQITSLAARTGATLVDMEAKLSTDNMVDHVHFNDQGYQQMAEAWFSRLGGGGGGGGGCFVATAAYGDPHAAPVERFRSFRDHYLLATPGGRWAVGFYYRFGPGAARIVESSPALRIPVRRVLDRIDGWIVGLPEIRPLP